MHRPEPIIVVDLFPKLEQKLIELLNGLTPADWRKPTMCPQWTVKDIVAHLLDGNLRRLSRVRDGQALVDGIDVKQDDK